MENSDQRLFVSHLYEQPYVAQHQRRCSVPLVARQSARQQSTSSVPVGTSRESGILEWNLASRCASSPYEGNLPLPCRHDIGQGACSHCSARACQLMQCNFARSIRRRLYTSRRLGSEVRDDCWAPLSLWSHNSYCRRRQVQCALPLRLSSQGAHRQSLFFTQLLQARATQTVFYNGAAAQAATRGHAVNASTPRITRPRSRPCPRRAQ
jgi:hypothetical protein